MRSGIVSDALKEAEFIPESLVRARPTTNVTKMARQRTVVFNGWVGRVKDMLRQGSGRSTIRGADGEDPRKDGDAPAEDEATTFGRRAQLN